MARRQLVFFLRLKYLPLLIMSMFQRKPVGLLTILKARSARHNENGAQHHH
jgi:hypothetical protein